jgi:hypothetical protein
MLLPLALAMQVHEKLTQAQIGLLPPPPLKPREDHRDAVRASHKPSQADA